MARERKFSTDDLFLATKQLLLQLGYEGFTFSHLADQLEVARGTIYKYYENKEELITDYMLYEMELFLFELKEIRDIQGFMNQLDFLLQLIFRNSTLHQIIEVGRNIPVNSSEKVKVNKNKLDRNHLEMYGHLHEFVKLGKREEILNPKLPDNLILGFIFQSIAIPNHYNVPHTEWVEAIKEIICHGIFTSS